MSDRKFLVREFRNGTACYAIVHNEPPKIAKEDRYRIQVVRELTGDELTMTLTEISAGESR